MSLTRVVLRESSVQKCGSIWQMEHRVSIVAVKNIYVRRYSMIHNWDIRILWCSRVCMYGVLQYNSYTSYIMPGILTRSKSLSRMSMRSKYILYLHTWNEYGIQSRDLVFICHSSMFARVLQYDGVPVWIGHCVTFPIPCFRMLN